MEWWQIVLIVVGGIIILATISALIFISKSGSLFYHVTFSRRKDDARFAELENPEDKKAPSRVWYSNQKLEEFSITSFDNLKLKGYFLNNNSNKLLICLHGYRGRYYSNTTQAQIFYEAGYDVFLPNNRAHDTSEGDFFSMGPKEQNDVIDWINFMVEKNPQYEIVLMGISMGAHIAMMTAGRKDFPKNVKCVIEDCGYADLKDDLKHEVYKLKTLKFKPLILFGGELYCKVFHHHSLKDNTKDGLKNLNVPILLIHGDKDTYVDYKNLQINTNNVPENIYKEIVTFEGAGHNESKNQLEKYKDTLINFVNKFIK